MRVCKYLEENNCQKCGNQKSRFFGQICIQICPQYKPCVNKDDAVLIFSWEEAFLMKQAYDALDGLIKLNPQYHAPHMKKYHELKEKINSAVGNDGDVEHDN